MQEEVFGPILPIIVVDSVDAAIKFVQERPHALALHAFSKSEKVLDRIFAATRSGSANGNDAALLTFANSNLPFGGVG
jgi:aldehyde dehydrogenase (NAD+)